MPRIDHNSPSLLSRPIPSLAGRPSAGLLLKGHTKTTAIMTTTSLVQCLTNTNQTPNRTEKEQSILGQRTRVHVEDMQGRNGGGIELGMGLSIMINIDFLQCFDDDNMFCSGIGYFCLVGVGGIRECGSF